MTRASETTREVTGITYEGVTYSLVPRAKQSGGRVETCPVCDGTGQMYSRKCKECHGRGLIQVSSEAQPELKNGDASSMA